MTTQPPSPVRPGARLTSAGVPSPCPSTSEDTVNPQHRRADAARAARARRSQRRAVRTVAGAIAWLAVTDLDRPRRAPFDSHAAWADR